MILTMLSFGLVIVHFSIPLAYYVFLKRQYNKPWNLRIDKAFIPPITIILPTYNESKWGKNSLDHLKAQDYPKNKLTILVIDSASTDGTQEIVENWIANNPSIDAKLIREPVRRGKLFAVIRGVESVDPSSIVTVLTDADAFMAPNAIREAVSFFADPSVGAVTGNISYVNKEGQTRDDTYRAYSNFVRVAESKFHSTPVMNGPLLAIRTSILIENGLPDFMGSDDSAIGSYIAFTGHRVIQVDAAVAKEYVRGSVLERRLRRANCLVLNFRTTKSYAKKKTIYVRSPFDSIWKMESWLTLVNPWLFVGSVISNLAAIPLERSFASAILLILGALLLPIKSYRTWVSQQLYLVLGSVRGLWNKDAIWDMGQNSDVRLS